MIKKILFHFMGPRYYIPLMFFLIGLVIFYLSFQMYQDTSHQSLEKVQTSKLSNKEPDLRIRELKSLFPKTLGNGKFEVIAENNLFSPKRQEWKPPQTESKQVSKQSREKRELERKKERVSHKGIRLYGTSITPSKKYALMYFQSFQSKRKYRMVQEENTVRDDGERGEWMFFRIKEINSTKVVLKDPQGGSFQVGLYDHKRKYSKKSQSSDGKKERISVVIGGKDEVDSGSEGRSSTGKGQEEQKSASKMGSQKSSESEQAEGKSSSSKSEQVGGEASESSQGSKEQGDSSEKKPTNPFKKLLDKMKQGQKGSSSSQSSNQGQNEESGQMKTIETPFGTIHRPAN